MEKGNEQNCIRYLEHYSKWLPSKHYYMTDVKVALAQIIGSGGPDIIQGTTEDELNMKIQLCQELLKLFEVISSGMSKECFCIFRTLNSLNILCSRSTCPGRNFI